jgi:RNA polymerase sigma factor (sigma-70 family)
MADASTGEIGRNLRQLFVAGSAVGMTDGQLLERFVAADRRGDRAGDEGEAAFETILMRHGATVLSVCRQVLGDGHAAEDAFQATFLVLVRRARSLRLREGGSLGAWLHGVAFRTAMKARKGAARRRAREHRVARPEARAGLAVAAVEQNDLGAAMHAEVHRLPAKYRDPVVLCYFEGRTHDEAAASLNWPVGTVRCRLSRARDLLRSRLVRRGLAPAVAALDAAWTGPSAKAAVSASLLRATLDAAARGVPARTGGAMLADLVLEGLRASRLRLATAALCLVATAAGLVLAIRGATGSPSADPPTTPARLGSAPPRPAPVDRFGDPLPEHARSRMGTLRFNDGEGMAHAAFSGDGKTLFTASWRRGVRSWDVASGRAIGRIVGEHDGDSYPECAISPDGRTLAIRSADRLELRDAATGRGLRRWHLPKGGYSSRPRFSPDGKQLAMIYNPKDRAASKGEITQAIDVWDTTATTEHRRRLEGVSSFLWDYRFSPDGKSLALIVFDRYRGPDDQSVPASAQLWDVAEGKERMRFPVAKKGFGPISVTFLPDGRRLFVGLTDQTIRMYDLADRREIAPPLNHEHELKKMARWDEAAESGPFDRTMDCLTFSPDGSILAASARWTDYRGEPPSDVVEIWLWDVARDRILRRFQARDTLVMSLAFTPDGKTIASTGQDPVVRLWDVATGREASIQAGHWSGIARVVVSPVDGTIFTGGKDGTIRRWDADTGRELEVIASLPHEITAIAVSPDGMKMLVGGGQQLRLWSVPERREIRRFRRIGLFQTYDPRHLIYSPDGKRFASDLGVFDASTGERLVAFRDRKFADDHLATYYPIFFSPDGQQIITAEVLGARVWDIATGREVRWAVSTKFQPDNVVIAGQMALTAMPAALSPDGRCLATSGSIYFDGWAKERFDPAIRVWDLATGRQVSMMEGHRGSIRSLAYSPDGQLLASCSADLGTVKDSTLRVWDATTGRELRRLEGHMGLVNELAFTRDGRSLVSAGEDATALVWDVSDLRDR